MNNRPRLYMEPTLDIQSRMRPDSREAVPCAVPRQKVKFERGEPWIGSPLSLSSPSSSTDVGTCARDLRAALLQRGRFPVRIRGGASEALPVW